MFKYPKTTFKYKLSLLLAVTCCLFSLNVRAEMGLTPGHVYSLWDNINSATLKLATQYSDDQHWLAQLGHDQLIRHNTKTPADVLVQVEIYRQKLEHLKKLRNLKINSKIEVAREMDGSITPSVVFLTTGHLLDNLITALLTELPTDDLISPYFKIEQVEGMTLSDVYGLVELANRRMDQIVVKGNLRYAALSNENSKKRL